MVRRRPHLRWLAAATVILAHAAFGEIAPTASPVFRSTPAAAAGRYRGPHSVSPELAAIVAAGLPKYVRPATPPPAAPFAVARPGVIQLPALVVHGVKPPDFSERQLYTNKGLAEVAVKRYLSPLYFVLNPLVLPLFGHSAEANAMAQYEADERLQRYRGLLDTAEMIRKNGDPKESAALKNLIYDTFIRQPDWRDAVPRH